jgi:hypothetical protein
MQEFVASRLNILARRKWALPMFKGDSRGLYHLRAFRRVK